MSKDNPGLEGGHILVDFDGCLAHYEQGGYKAGELGAPIPVMVERVRRWLSEGRDVRIFTARRYSGGSLKKLQESATDVWEIEGFCYTNLGRRLPVVNYKTMNTDVIYDDIAVSVIRNTGTLVHS